MKKYIVGGTGKNKLFELAYNKVTDNTAGTCYVKIIAKDAIEAAEILINLEGIDAADIEYINGYKNERIIG